MFATTRVVRELRGGKTQDGHVQKIRKYGGISRQVKNHSFGKKTDIFG